MFSWSRISLEINVGINNCGRWSDILSKVLPRTAVLSKSDLLLLQTLVGLVGSDQYLHDLMYQILNGQC